MAENVDPTNNKTCPLVLLLNSDTHQAKLSTLLAIFEGKIVTCPSRGIPVRAQRYLPREIQLLPLQNNFYFSTLEVNDTVAQPIKLNHRKRSKDICKDNYNILPD